MCKAENLLLLIVLVAGLSACAGVERLTGQEPIIDMKGVDVAAYEQDQQECQLYADEVQVGRQTATGATAGAVLGGVVGAIFGNSNTAARTAGVGAATGAVQGAGGGLAERQQVIRTCLRGRGYRVLN